jgi:hypothetical protein
MLKRIVILLALALSACATQLGIRDKVDLRRQMFTQIVFAPDYDSRRKDFLAKWTSPLRITLKGDKTETFEQAKSRKSTVKQKAKALAALTGLDIAVVGENTPPNVTIFFAAIENMGELAGSRISNLERVQTRLLATGCHFTIEKDSGSRITGATIFIRTGDDVITGTSCLSQDLTSILGLSNNSELIQPSIFNANAQLRQPTTLDLQFIRALYAPALKAGMPRKQVLQELEKLLQ